MNEQEPIEQDVLTHPDTPQWLRIPSEDDLKIEEFNSNPDNLVTYEELDNFIGVASATLTDYRNRLEKAKSSPLEDEVQQQEREKMLQGIIATYEKSVDTLNRFKYTWNDETRSMTKNDLKQYKDQLAAAHIAMNRRAKRS